MRNVLCLLVFALCCACVFAAADASVSKSQVDSSTTTTTTTTTTKAPGHDGSSIGSPLLVQAPLVLLASTVVASVAAW